MKLTTGTKVKAKRDLYIQSNHPIKKGDELTVLETYLEDKKCKVQEPLPAYNSELSYQEIVKIIKSGRFVNLSDIELIK
jgi:hypothetical protein